MREETWGLAAAPATLLLAVVVGVVDVDDVEVEVVDVVGTVVRDVVDARVDVVAVVRVEVGVVDVVRRVDVDVVVALGLGVEVVVAFTTAALASPPAPNTHDPVMTPLSRLSKYPNKAGVISSPPYGQPGH